MTVKVKGARFVFYKQWDEITGEEYYNWVKISDLIYKGK